MVHHSCPTLPIWPRAGIEVDPSQPPDGAGSHGSIDIKWISFAHVAWCLQVKLRVLRVSARLDLCVNAASFCKFSMQLSMFAFASHKMVKDHDPSTIADQRVLKRILYFATRGLDVHTCTTLHTAAKCCKQVTLPCDSSLFAEYVVHPYSS